MKGKTDKIWSLTREEEQAVSMLMEGPFSPSVNEILPQTTESVPDVAV